MKFFLCIILCCLLMADLSAQDNLKMLPKTFDSTLFADDDTLTRSDYLQGIERMFKVLNKAPGLVSYLNAIDRITGQMNEDDAALAIIRERLTAKDRPPNIRNLQMFGTLLSQLSVDTESYSDELNDDDEELDDLKKEIYNLRKDSVIRVLFRDPKNWKIFAIQLSQLKTKWKLADSLVKQVNIRIDNTLARITASTIQIEELQNLAQQILQSTGSKALEKERRYIWEPRANPLSVAAVRSFQKSLEDEQLITHYYFAHTRNQLFLLLFCGIIFFIWTFYNYSSLRGLGKLDALASHQIIFITRFPLLATLIFILNLAPLFDLNAPAIYSESVEVILILVLAIYLIKLKKKNFLVLWLLFLFFFILITFTRLFGIPFHIQRWWTFLLNGLSVLLGLFSLIHFRKEAFKNKLLFVSGILFALFNLLSVLGNAYGRTTLSQILGTTGFYIFAETFGLIVFIKVIQEFFLLQIQGSRMRKNYPVTLDFSVIGGGIANTASYLAFFIWLVVLSTNLNIYAPIEQLVTDFLIKPRVIGNFSIKLSGVLLFIVIIWVANFLQKYIGYFFGDVGDEASLDNKGQRSKLMITRLILITAGFLLAIAASGLALNQITIILGALGVGIGLGLQNIVNNFVSGIILIFDRPIRIGDSVEIGDQKVRVREISVRSSTLLTTDGAEVIIPNGDILSKNIINWTFSNSHARVKVSFTIDHLVISEELLNGIKQIISNNADVLISKEPEILIETINANATELNIHFWCKDVLKSARTRSNIYAEIYKHLIEFGVKIL